MSRRMKAYLLFRGSAAGLFLISATLLPRGVPAIVGCVVAGIGSLATCIGVNAGGPGEQAGARVQQQSYEKARAPQGDWPPFDEDRIVDGEVLR